MPPLRTISRQSPIQLPSQNGSPQSAWPDQWINILLYGLSGTGKTTLWSTFPGPLLVGICSGTIRSGELRSIDTPEIRKKIEPYVLYSDNDVKFFVDKAQTGSYKGVVLDHVSGLQDLYLKTILGWEKLPEQKSWGMATMQEYGQAGLQAKEICRKLLDCNCNTILIGQETLVDPKEYSTSELTDGLSPKIGVDATKAFARWLNPAVDYNCRTFTRRKMIKRMEVMAGREVEVIEKGKEIEYGLYIAESDVVTTKLRVPRGTFKPELIINPDYAKLMLVINGKWKPEMV